MLRALFERGIAPDLVLGTSVGALNGAMVARDPSSAVIDRLTDLWQTVGEPSSEVFGDRPLRTVRRAVATGTHVFSAKPLRRAAGRRVRRPHLRGPAGHLRGVRGQHRARRRALVHQRPAGARDRRERRRTRPAAAGQGRRRALPRRRHRQLHPGRPRGGSSGPPGSSCSRSAGSTGRWPAASGRGRSPGSPSRSRAGTGSSASWPSCRTASRRTCCRPRGTSSKDDTLLGAPRLRRRAARGSMRRTTPRRPTSTSTC